MKTSVIAAVAFFCLAAGCRREAAEPPPVEPEAQARELAEQASARLMKELGGRLRKALEEGPPEEAVRVCAEVAQEVSAAVAREEGVRMQRTALRLRNRANAPDAYERLLLEQWSRPGTEAATHVEIVSGEGGRELRYVQPIRLQPLCLTCHGPTELIGEPVLRAIAAHYPDDQATGFEVGELRGVVSVRVPLPEPSPTPARH